MEWLKGADIALSPHFRSPEFTCHCSYTECEKQFVDPRLLTALEAVRKELGEPIRVTSGFRCHKYQEALAASGHETAKGISQHELGAAADLACDSMAALLAILNQHFKAIGVAQSFIHVDLRSDKERRWTYTSS